MAIAWGWVYFQSSNIHMRISNTRTTISNSFNRSSHTDSVLLEPDDLNAVTNFLQQQTRRCLAVIIIDIVDVTSREMLFVLWRLTARYLLFCVAVRSHSRRVGQDLRTNNRITVIATSCCNPKHLNFCDECVSPMGLKARFFSNFQNFSTC